MAFLPGEMATLPDLLIHYQIVTNGPLVFALPRRLAGERLTAWKQEFDLLLLFDSLRVSGPVLCTWCPRLGASSALQVPLPITEDVLQENSDSVFLVIDSKRAFYQILIVPKDVCKTAVATPFDLFEFAGMLMGANELSHQGATFRPQLSR